MTTKENPQHSGGPGNSSSEFHLVLGAGGSKAILAATGAIAAFELAGFNRFKTVGGISGGSVPAILYANKTKPKEIVYTALHSDFSNFMEPRVGMFRRIWALLRKYRYEITLPERGIYSPEPLKRFIDISVPEWPKCFWTLCTDRQFNQVVLTADGAHRYLPEITQGENLLQEPLCTGTAVTTSCAIPGIIDAGKINDEAMFDGAMSHEGQCAILPPQRHFGAEPAKIIALDVGEEDVKKNPLVKFLMRLTCTISTCGPMEAPHPSEEEHGIILIEPRINRFHGLKFLLDDLDKWSAIVAGFNTAVETLQRHGLITRENAARAFELYDALVDVPFDRKSRDECSECIADLFRSFDVL